MSNTFTAIDFELFNNEIMEKDRQFYLGYYTKLTQIDSSGPMQRYILLSKFGDLSIKHKELVLNKYIELIKAQNELIGSYLDIVEAGAGNISPAGNITAILTAVINFINIGALTTALGEFQGDFRIYAEKPLTAYVSDIAQATESIRDENLNTFNNALTNAVILPDKILK